MSGLDELLETPCKIEVDSVELALSMAKAWSVVRHADLARLPLVHALFRLRTGEEPTLRLDDFRSTPEHPGFQVLSDDGRSELVVGAIGKVYQRDIPFVHVATPAAYRAFREPGYVKVAWAIELEPRGSSVTRVTVEVRVDATDDASWRAFRRYFRLIGPASHFIRRAFLAHLAREYGTPESKENERSLTGDELLPDAVAQMTDAIVISAAPEAIWPWLLQMGCRRAGFYSVDSLDNGGTRSAREIHPDLQHVVVGDVLPARPRGDDGFEVLRIDPDRAFVLGGLYDVEQGRQIRFSDPRPRRYWQVTWAFVLEPIDRGTTRLHARARASFPPGERIHAAWIRRVHEVMQSQQLQHIAARVEQRIARDDWRDVLEGVSGAAMMVAAMLTPFLRRVRNHWGVDAAAAARPYPGDELVPHPLWSWTHGIEIEAPAERVWPWVAQIGADRGGFYSYQWLENVAGCELGNAEVIHPEWQAHAGDELRLHPKAPALDIVELVPNRRLVAHAPVDVAAKAGGKPWAEVSWLFELEPLGPSRSRLISRYRCACSSDLATRLALGPTLLEPIGFVMDRRMLLGVKERAERVERAERTEPVEPVEPDGPEGSRASALEGAREPEPTNDARLPRPASA